LFIFSFRKDNAVLIIDELIDAVQVCDANKA